MTPQAGPPYYRVSPKASELIRDFTQGFASGAASAAFSGMVEEDSEALADFVVGPLFDGALTFANDVITDLSHNRPVDWKHDAEDSLFAIGESLLFNGLMHIDALKRGLAIKELKKNPELVRMLFGEAFASFMFSSGIESLIKEWLG